MMKPVTWPNNIYVTAITDVMPLWTAQVPLLIVHFFFWRNCPRAVDAIEFLKRRLRPDAETTDMTAGSYLQQIQMLDVDQRDSRDVAERPRDAVILRVDHYRAAALDASTVSHLADASTETSRVLYLNACTAVYVIQLFTRATAVS